jgi:hypothetical protein
VAYIANNYYQLNAPNPALVWQLTYISGPASVTFPGGVTSYTTPASSAPTSAVMSISYFYGGTTSYTVTATLHTDYGQLDDTQLQLGSYTFNLICEFPDGSGSPTADDFCSFQLAPPTYTTISGPPYNGNQVIFTYPTIQNVDITAASVYDSYSVPYFTAPGPQASFYALTITPGWSYAYTTSPTTLLINPPSPPQPPYQPYSADATLFAIGSGSAIGSSTNCTTSYAALPLQVNYPLDSPPVHLIDTTFTPIFTNSTNILIHSANNEYDLKTKGSISLTASLTCDQPNFVSIDWYEVDNTGNETLVAEATSKITVKVAGDYLAKVNLAQGATVNPTTGAQQNYSGSNYYIAQSNIAEVFNSSSSSANVDSMSVYPNPACGKLTVNYLLSGKVSSAGLIITNASTGAVVIKESLYTTQQTQAVNISSLLNGTYIATIEVNGGTAGSDSRTFVIMCN